MGYGLIPIVASITLMLHHVAITEASHSSKVSVVGVVTVSLAILWYWPQWLVVATLLQVGISIYMLMHLRWNTDAA